MKTNLTEDQTRKIDAVAKRLQICILELAKVRTGNDSGRAIYLPPAPIAAKAAKAVASVIVTSAPRKAAKAVPAPVAAKPTRQSKAPLITELLCRKGGVLATELNAAVGWPIGPAMLNRLQDGGHFTWREVFAENPEKHRYYGKV